MLNRATIDRVVAAALEEDAPWGDITSAYLIVETAIARADLVARDLPVPDVVVYLQAPTEMLKRRLRDRSRWNEDEVPLPDEDYLAELNEAYNHFFFHYTATPLLVVETSQMDLSWGDETIDELLRQIKAMGRGTQYYVPRTGA